MTIIQELKKTIASRKPDYITSSFLNKFYEFDCVECQTKLELNLDNQIENSWNGKTENINSEEENELKVFYRIGMFNKAVDGGLAVFDKMKCGKCEAEYVTYCGVQEFSNSQYNVYVHGIAMIDNKNGI
jgi:hypothetical protein